MTGRTKQAVKIAAATPGTVSLAGDRATRSLRPQGQATQARLLDAGRRVFATKGVAGARVADVATEAGTSHGTFYLYFSSKDALFDALGDETMNALEEFATRGLSIGTGRTGWNQLAEWVRELVTLYRTHSTIIMAWADGRLLNDPALLARGLAVAATLSDDFNEHLTAKPGDTSRNPTVVGLALVALLERVNHLLCYLSPDLSVDEIANTLTSIIWTGLFQRRAPTPPPTSARPKR